MVDLFCLIYFILYYKGTITTLRNRWRKEEILVGLFVDRQWLNPVTCSNQTRYLTMAPGGIRRQTLYRPFSSPDSMYYQENINAKFVVIRNDGSHVNVVTNTAIF